MGARRCPSPSCPQTGTGDSRETSWRWPGKSSKMRTNDMFSIWPILTFFCFSPPCRYSLSSDGALLISFRAMSDAATPINLANHVYWNLGGHQTGKRSLEEHLVAINANSYTPVDERTLPTGEIRQV